MFTVKIYYRQYDLTKEIKSDNEMLPAVTHPVSKEWYDIKSAHSVTYSHDYGWGDITSQSQELVLRDKEGNLSEAIPLRSSTYCTGDVEPKPVCRVDIEKIIIENMAGKTTQYIPWSEPIRVEQR